MGNTLMSASGGLSNKKLLLATASPDDVISDKSFYAGDKIIKTGTMTNNGSLKITINPNETTYIPKGYHDGSGYVHSKTISGNATMNPGMNSDNWASSLPTSKGRASATINVSVAGNSIRIYGTISGWIEGNNGQSYGSGKSSFDQTFYINYV